MKWDFIDKKPVFYKRFLIPVLCVILVSAVFLFVFQKSFNASTPSTLSNKKTIFLISGENKYDANVEIATTPEDQEKGLMYRTSMQKDDGMIFVFPYSSGQSFWMKNTLIPLDIMFFDEKGNLLNIANAIPCTEKDDSKCAVYYSNGSSKYVLEMNAGWAKEHNLKNTSRLSLENL